MLKKKKVLWISLLFFLTACGGGGGEGTSSSQSATPQGPLTSVAVSWDAPQQYTDGNTLDPSSDLSSYNVYYGTASHSYSAVVNVPNPGAASGITETLDLAPGTYYIVVTAVSRDNVESDYSNEITKSI